MVMTVRGRMVLILKMAASGVSSKADEIELERFALAVFRSQRSKKGARPSPNNRT
jgi:hypothetical protein